MRKLVEDNVGENLYNFRYGDDFLNNTKGTIQERNN